MIVVGRGRWSHTANFPVQSRAVGVHDHSLLYLVVLGPVLSDDGWWWLLVMVDGLYGERLVAHSPAQCYQTSHNRWFSSSTVHRSPACT